MSTFLRMMSVPVFILMMCCCNNSPEKISEQKNADSIARVTARDSSSIPQKNDTVQLKNIMLNEKAVMGKRLLHESQLLENDTKAQNSLTSIDSITGKKGFKYHLIDTLFSGKNISVVLVGREYAEENIIWMILLDAAGNLTGSKELYYDNAEGFRSVHSEIKNNLITITTNNDYAETAAEQKIKQQFFIDGYKIAEKH